MKRYKMSNLGMLHHFPGVKIHKDGIFISQMKYAKKVLRNFRMFRCKIVENPLVCNEKYLNDNGKKKVDEQQ